MHDADTDAHKSGCGKLLNVALSENKACYIAGEVAVAKPAALFLRCLLASDEPYRTSPDGGA